MNLASFFELGKSLNFKIYSSNKEDENLKFVLFPYTSGDVYNTIILIFMFFFILGYLVYFLFSYQIILILFLFFGMTIDAILYVYAFKIYPMVMISEYKAEMLNLIMRFTIYLSMNTNLEYAVKSSVPYLKGVLKVQFQDILIKLERKEFINLSYAFKKYSPIWNKYSPVFVDSLKLLEIASLTEEKESEEIMEESIQQIILSYNIEQKRASEKLTEKISKVITVGVMLPIMGLMLLPLISVFLPNIVKASGLFFLFNILIPVYIFVNTLDFSAQRLQLFTVNIEESKEFKKVPSFYYIFSFIIFLIASIFTTIYLIRYPPSIITFDQFNLVAIFYSWLIPASLSLGLFIVTYIYYRKNKNLWEKFSMVEEDIPHLLSYFAIYLHLNVPLENIFREVTQDYINHGFEDHPTVKIFRQISFKLDTMKIGLAKFIKTELMKFSSIRSLNEVLIQIVSFNEFSSKKAAQVAKRIRQQKVDFLKLNDYILTLLSSSIDLIGSTINFLIPLLSSLAIIMSLFVVKFIQYLSSQLEVIANLGNTGSRIHLQLVNIKQVISPVYLGLIITFYVLEIIVIFSYLKSNLENGYNKYKIIVEIMKSQLGFIIYSILLFGGYVVVKSISKNILGM